MAYSEMLYWKVVLSFALNDGRMRMDGGPSLIWARAGNKPYFLSQIRFQCDHSGEGVWRVELSGGRGGVGLGRGGTGGSLYHCILSSVSGHE